MDRILTAIGRLTGWRHFPIAAGLILIAVFMVSFYWRDMVRGAMCSQETEHCTREWISATGGWIAVIFAYLTIRTMNRQTEETNRHQRENVELQVIDKMTMAKRVIGQATAASTLCQSLIATIDRRMLEGDYREFNIIDELEHIRKFVIADEIRMVALTSTVARFDPLYALDVAEAHLANFNFEALRDNKDSATAILKYIRTYVALARDGFQTARYDGNRFIERWRSRYGAL